MLQDGQISVHERHEPTWREVSIGFVSTYPPTQCGLATFTAATRAAIASRPAGGRTGVVQIVDGHERSRRAEVMGWLHTSDSASRRRAAAALRNFDVTVVQHEFGIYGGRDGEHVVDLLDELTTPRVVVLHTVLSAPTAHQREVLEQVLARADRLVVMSGIARARLVEVHGIDPADVVVIPHGATPNLGAVPAGRTALTWGLIGPGKGIEWAVDAFATLRDLDPPARYVVTGQTHPRVAELHGEAYKDSLRARAASSAAAGMVTFDDRYCDEPGLLRLIRGADVVLLPYDSTEQVTSGVLVEALASGKPVVATAFPHAVELLSGGAGVVVAHRDPQALGAALRAVLTDQALRARLTDAALQLAPSLFWSTVAQRYVALATELEVPGLRTAARMGA